MYNEDVKLNKIKKGLNIMTDFKEKCIKEVKSMAKEINELREDYDKFYEYFNDVLDVEYRIASNGSYRGAYIYLTLGGPNIWVDTFKGTIELRWGYDSASWLLSVEIVEMIDDMFKELYSCLKY